MSEFTFSEWQWNEAKGEFQYWHEPSNLILVVWESADGWCWEIREYTGDLNTDGSDVYEVVAAWDKEMPLPYPSAESAQLDALAWLEADHD